MKKIKLLLLPLIYARRSILLTIPFTFIIFLFYDINITYIFFGVITFWFIYVSLFIILMSKFKLMKKFTTFLIKVLNINYNTDNYWKDTVHYHGLVNEYPILEVNNKKYFIYLTQSDSNLYDKEEYIKRKAIYAYIKDNK